jgi:hypothetical protein
MSNFEHYATFDESIAMLRDLTAKGFRVIHNPGVFDEPSAPQHAEVTDELVALLREQSYYFLVGDFSRYPPQFRRIAAGDAAGKYKIEDLDEGPVMPSSLACVREIEGAPTLVLGYVALTDQLRNPETGAWEKPSPEARAAHRLVVSTMKKHLVTHQLGMKFWIGPDALRLFTEGKARITDWGILHGSRK